MENLWERMTHLYGHKFTSTYGEFATANGVLTDVAQTWASALQGLVGDQLADGLRACIDCGEAWPPSVPEFVGMCKKKSLNDFGLSYTPEYHREQPKALPNLKGPEDINEFKEKWKNAMINGLTNKQE